MNATGSPPEDPAMTFMPGCNSSILMVTQHNNLSESSGFEQWPFSTQCVLGAIIFLMSITSIAGNLCTIVSFCRYANLRTPQHLYIINLAITDLITGMISIPIYGFYTLMNYHWPLGKWACKVWTALDFVIVIESALTVIMITYDRLTLLKFGIEYMQRVTKKGVLIKIVISWILVFFPSFPFFLGYDLWQGYSLINEYTCQIEFIFDSVIIPIFAFTFNIFPVICVITLNSLVLYYILQRRRKVHQSSCTNFHLSYPNASVNQGGNSPMLSADKKAAKTLAVLVLIFFSTSIPYSVTIIVSIICQCVPWYIFELAWWMVSLACCLNPFAYAFISPKFRQAFKKMLCLQAK